MFLALPVIFISFPFKRIILNVRSYSVKVHFISYNVIIKSCLPFEIRMVIRMQLFGNGAFKPPYYI